MRQTRKLLVRTMAAGGGILILLLTVVAGWRARRALQLSAEEVHAEREIRFESHRFAPPLGASFELVSAPAVFLQAARFQDHLYIGGPGGLLEYDLTGTASPQFISGPDLPPPPPVSPSPAPLTDGQEPELVAATTQEG